jgi:hypothetical protein
MTKLQCPQCESHEVTEHDETRMIGYGSKEQVTLVVVMPLMRCGGCGLIYSDERGERATTETIARYQRVLLGLAPNMQALHRSIMARIEELMPMDPKIGTREGDELSKLAEVAGLYEGIMFPEFRRKP